MIAPCPSHKKLKRKNLNILLTPTPRPTPTPGGSTIALPGLGPGELKVGIAELLPLKVFPLLPSDIPLNWNIMRLLSIHGGE